MIALGNILIGIGQVLEVLLMTMGFFLMAAVVVSWLNADPFNPIVRWISAATEPVLRPIRRIVPTVGPGIDFSPVVAILICYFLRVALALSLIEYGAQIKRSAVYRSAAMAAKIVREAPGSSPHMTGCNFARRRLTEIPSVVS